MVAAHLVRLAHDASYGGSALSVQEVVVSFVPTGPTEVQRVTAPVAPPDVVETRFAGRFEFVAGIPTESTLASIFDQIDFQRGCQAFLRNLMAAAVWGFYRGFTRDLGVQANEVAVFHLDANGLALTGNSETIYGMSILDTKSGPLVLEIPQRMLGLLNDQWMRPMADLGIAGADHGQGGRYLLVPPGHSGDVPSDGFVDTIHLRTFRQWLGLRAFMGPDGDPQAGIDLIGGTKIYPLAQADDPHATRVENVTGKPFDTIHPTDIRYFEDLAEMIDYEPIDAIDPEVGALLAQIGIEKGKPFAPDDRMRGILDQAAQVGSFMAFATANAPRDSFQRWKDRNYFDNIHGYPTFRDEHGRPEVDHMVEMAWFATGRAMAMLGQKPGVGSGYTWEYIDTNGDWIDPTRSYRLHLPGPIPVKDFWSVVVYDLWTRSMLANGQAHPSINSYSPGVELNDDGGVDVYIGPQPPPGKEHNWIRTLPDIPWFPIIRLYGPLEPWIDHTWKPDDLTPLD
jgi:hypothetical protein